MAARPESRFALQAMKVRFMPPDEGVRHLLDELLTRGRHTEVAFVDREGRAAHHVQAATGTPREFGRQHRGEIVEFLRLAADHWGDTASSRLPLPPVLQQAFAAHSDDELRDVAAGAEVAFASLLAHRPQVCRLLRPASDIFLRDHVLHDRPFLPAVASAEILAEAASLLAPGWSFAGFRGLEFLQGQPFPTEAPLAVVATVRRTSQGWECELTGAGVMGGDTKSVLVRGIAEFLPTPQEPPQLPVDNPNFRWTPFAYADRGNAPVTHGASLRTLNEIALQRDGGRGRLTARAPLELAGDRRGQRWLMPSALLDGCFVACGTYAFVMLDGRYGLPRGIERLRIFGLPAAGEACRFRFTLRDDHANGSWYDFHLVDSSGRCLAIAEKHQVATLTRRK
jgi:hypothetical protein